MRAILPLLCLLLLATPAAADPPADLVIHNAHILTVDAKFSTASALAVLDGKIIAVGKSSEIRKLYPSPKKEIDAHGKTVLPGLMDSHVHPVDVVSTELAAKPPLIRSLKEAFAEIRRQTTTVPKGEWIVLRYVFPTRLDEARFPTKAELDNVAPDHPVLFHAGPAGVANSQALKVSGVTKDTKNPSGGQVVKDATTGEPTGLLRNAYGVLRGVPRVADHSTRAEKLAGLKKLFALYNEQGLTSIADRNGSAAGLALYRELYDKGDLTLRVNIARSFDPYGSREEVVRKLEALPGKDGKGGPTGTGDDMLRIGPIKLFLDGGMLNGTAYMRQPWPRGQTYQVTEDHYRGLLFIPPEQLKMVIEEGVRRKWQMTAHTAGEAGMDVLLDAYEEVNRLIPGKELRHCITHANFPSKRNLERCRELGVVADVQPAWLYKDGHTLQKVLGDERVRWFQPYKSWLKYTTIGGGSDHMLRYDSLDSTNPWNPWLAIWTTLERATERGGVPVPDEKLTREEAIRLYTINNAYLTHEEKVKGSLEAGKLADFILIDRDIMTCPLRDLRDTRVLMTVMGGKVVYERKE
jgi:predicted amidohydrolase YtcJ